MNVAYMIDTINGIAPIALSESWDNSGLQVGDPSWPVQRIVLALDPTLDVIDDACRRKADLLITHHPLIFKPLKSIDLSTTVGKAIRKCLSNKLALLSAHTNLDSVNGGVNDVLARKIGLDHLVPLVPTTSAPPEKYKFTVYVPESHKDKVMDALFKSGCGIIGDYTCCAYYGKGTGTFLPGEATHPATGTRGTLNHVDECRIESVIEKHAIPGAIAGMKQCHPYETPAYDIYPLFSGSTGEGLGRVGRLKPPMRFEDFSLKVKEALGVHMLKTVGRGERMVEKVAVCSGSGSSLIGRAVSSGVDVYVSGDLHYHDARLMEEQDLCMIDAGHFPSEHIVLEALKQAILEKLGKNNEHVQIICCDLERDPFQYI